MAKQGKRGARRFKALMALALAGVVAWSVLWFVAATIVDRQIEKAEIAAGTSGTTIACVHRDISGFPFRIEVRCKDGSHVGNGRDTVTVAGLAVTALVYNPSRVIAEVRGPVTLGGEGGLRFAADWSLAHASARLDLGEGALERFDAEVVDFVLEAVGAGELRMAEVDVNVRRNPQSPDDVDFAASLDRLVPFSGGEPARITLQGRLEGAAGLLKGDAQSVLQRALSGSLPLVIDTVQLDSAGLRVAANGNLTLGRDGKLDGKLDVAVSGHDKGLPYVGQLAPQHEDTINTLITNLLTYAPDTKIGEHDAKKVSLVVNDGVVKAGIVTLYTVPPVKILAQR